MKHIIIIVYILCILLIVPAGFCRTFQKMDGFYLSSYKQNGMRNWELHGKEAFLYDAYIDINKMEARYFALRDTITIKSQKAKLDKTNMDVFLRENVKITNQTGSTLLTDSLNWKQQTNLIETNDWVQGDNTSMHITAKGLNADTQLRKVNFMEEVVVTLPDEKTSSTIVITCQGPLKIEFSQEKATFHKDVVVESPEGKLFSDLATVFFNTKEKKIIKIVAEDNVRIVKDNNISFAQKATFNAQSQELVLEGKPKILYHTAKKLE